MAAVRLVDLSAAAHVQGERTAQCSDA